MKLKSSILVLLCLAVAMTRAGADYTINWSSNFLARNILSDGVTTFEASPYTFTFLLGASTVALAPDNSNLEEWAAGWVSLGPPAPYSGAVTDHNFSSSSVFSANAPVFPAGGQAYIWGHNTTNLAGGLAEWIVMADQAWKWPTASVDPFSLTWTVGSADPLAAKLGSINPAYPTAGPNFHMQTAHIFFSVPEPGSAGLAALAGLALLRRRRSGNRLTA